MLWKKKNDDETESNKDEGITEKSEEVSQNLPMSCKQTPFVSDLVDYCVSTLYSQ